MLNLARKPPLAPARSSTDCVKGSEAVERELAPLFAKAVQDRDAGLIVHVQFPCTPVRAAPGRVRALVVAGHGGYARVVGVSPGGPDTFRVRALRVSTGGGPNHEPTGNVEFFRRDVPGTAFAAVFDRIRTALATRISTARRPPSSSDQIELGPFGISSANSSFELQLEDSFVGMATRAWQGYGGTLGAEDRVPTEFAWQSLRSVIDEETPLAAAEPEDRALLAAAWAGVEGFPRPRYVTQALLILARQAGSADVLPAIIGELDSKEPETQSLAADALASITGQDLRYDSDGRARFLGDVVTDYKRECVGQ